MNKLLALLIVALLAMSPALAAESASPLLLHYPFADADGQTVTDWGPLGISLSAGTAMSWSTPAAGVGGGAALGRIGDGDIISESQSVAGKGLDDLRSFTVSGWFKLSFSEKNSGVLFELVPAEGNGFQLHFATKPIDKQAPDKGLVHGLVSVIGPQGINPHTGEGVVYSPWDPSFVRVGEWVFFALAVDATKDEGAFAFYGGTEAEGVRRLGVFRKPPSWTRGLSLGKIIAVRMANSVDFKRPVPIGTWFDDFHFFGSAADASGALSQRQIESLRQSAVSGPRKKL